MCHVYVPCVGLSVPCVGLSVPCVGLVPCVGIHLKTQVVVLFFTY